MNEYRSLSISFRIELAFHALNMEGTSGNVMEPRRIALGDAEYDGISGEMVRRHIFENFRDMAGDDLPMHQTCIGLDPARGAASLNSFIAESMGDKYQAGEDFVPATEHLVGSCALCDIGGYLIPDRNLKRDSTFEAGWLITEHPSQADYTQHVAYRPDPSQNNLFTMGIRSGIYGGIMRIDLDRIGHNDWWWLAEDGANRRWPVSESDRRQRASAFLTSVRQWLLSPSGARQAGWLQHQGEPFEGVMVLSKNGPAPFISPIALVTENDTPRVKRNEDYIGAVQRLAAQDAASLSAFEFQSQDTMVEQFNRISEELGIG